MRWEVMDLKESVPAQIVITKDDLFSMHGPEGCGFPDSELNDLLPDWVKWRELRILGDCFPW